MSNQYIGGPYRLGTHQKVAFTGTAGTSAVISNGVNVVRVCMTSAGYIAFGTAPTATTSSVYMPAGVVEYFIVPDGGTTKISAVQDSAGGNVHITELSK
jgi:large exoprotein involved in heme utilization and adhesion